MSKPSFLLVVSFAALATLSGCWNKEVKEVETAVAAQEAQDAAKETMQPTEAERSAEASAPTTDVASEAPAAE